MNILFSHPARRLEKRRRSTALPDAGAFVGGFFPSKAFWTAPVLWRFGILLVATILAGNLFAADVAADFSTANKLYAEGKFSDAANAYETILRTGGQSSALLFNYANAEFKAGHPGKAIAAYRRAALLAPRDAEIRANLDFVRNQVQGATVHESRWQGWPGQLTFNEWTLLAAGAFCLTFLLLAARQISPALAPKLRGATFTLGFLTILFGAATGLQAMEHFSRPSAVVIADDAVARSGPFDEAQNTFAVHDGAELSILDHHGDWIQVADGPNKTGWMQTKQVEILPGA